MLLDPGRELQRRCPICTISPGAAGLVSGRVIEISEARDLVPKLDRGLHRRKTIPGGVMSHERNFRAEAEASIRGFRLVEGDADDLYRELSIHGELDLAVVGQLEEVLDRSACELTLIDLSECDFIDSSGIAVIIRRSRRVASDGGRLVVHSPSDQVLRVLTVTGLLDNGLVFRDREVALAAALPAGSAI